MPATASSRMPPLAVFLNLAAIAALLLSLSCLAAAAAMGNDDYGGSRVGTIDGRGTIRVAAAAATGATPPSSKWQRRLEEAVTPEFGSLLAADQGYINYNTLNMNRLACSGNSCAARGAAYTQPCLAIYQCRG